jgi:small-conductance mechanosensitive channel/CRP-like cAMP-binding protein
MSWLQEFHAHPILGAVACFALALAAVGLRQLAHRSPLGRRLDSAFLFIAAGLVFGGIRITIRLAGFSGATPYFDALLFGALAIGTVNAALTLFVDFYLRQRGGAVVSAIFRDVSSIVAYFLVIVVVLRTTLDINLASLVATSAVLTAIVGLALQDLLSNLFSGLVLELEAPFSRGDWVRVGQFEGTVEETGWRTTKLRTRVNEIVILPNAMLSKEAVVNYSRPDPLFGDTLRFEAAYEAPPNVVKDAVLGVLAAEPDVARMPEVEVRLERYGESGVGYAVRYWITQFGELDRIRNRIMTNLWYTLRRAGVRIPFPARDLFVHTGGGIQLAPDHPELFGTLRAVPLLAPLDDKALGRLASGVRRLTFGAGEMVVREGDVGDSFYVIERGEAEVTLDNGAVVKSLSRLHAGSFFGEMSLLAGEPRSATVRATTDLTVLVIDRDTFKEIISADPALLGPLSEIAARRQEAQREHRRFLEVSASDADRQQVQRLRERIKAFFRL